MLSLTVTELRRKLPAYLRRVEEGESFLVTVHGRAVARLIPEQEAAQAAYARLVALRPASWPGDVITPLDVTWNAEPPD
jgi:prevent-host-death family protein